MSAVRLCLHCCAVDHPLLFPQAPPSPAQRAAERRGDAMQLLKLVAHHIKVGVPLPFGVRNEEGKLLLACG